MMLQKYWRIIQDVRYQKMFDHLSGDCQDAYTRALSEGVSEHLLRWLLLHLDQRKINSEQFQSGCENSVYVTDLEMLFAEFSVSEKPLGAAREYSYPAAFMGACFGDIAGSVYESVMGLEEQDVAYRNCITADSGPTDDTILSCATAIVLQDLGSYQEYIENRSLDITDFAVDGTYPFARNPFAEQYKTAIHTSYPHPGFGGAFYRWASSESLKPYGSAGNGAAMRVSPIPEKYAKQEDVIPIAAMSAVATHNHLEGVKGAIVTAMLIWMAYRGYSKEQIYGYAVQHYRGTQHTLPNTQKLKNFDMQELRWKPGYPLSSFSVPAAAICFHESETFESAMDNVLSFSGDTDTIGAITGSIAGAYYGVSANAREIVGRFNTDQDFQKAYGILTLLSQNHSRL